MLNKERCYEIIDLVLAETGDHPTRVMLQSAAEGLSRYANSEIHQNVFEDVTSVVITVTDDRKRSRVMTTDYSDEGLRNAAADAVENLGFIPPGEEQAPLVREPGEILEDDYCDRLEEQYNVTRRAQLLKRALDTLDSGYKAFGRLTHKEMRLAFGNSEGARRFARSNEVSFSALVSSEEGGSGFAATTSSRVEDMDVPGAFERAYEKARLNRDREDIEPGRYTVILEPLAVGNILTFMSFIGFSAKSVQNQYSFLTGKKGEKVFDERVTLLDDHTDENTLSMPFDFEGYPRQVLPLVEDGVIRNFTYDAKSAAEDDVQSTGHSVDMPDRGGIPLHLVMAGGNQTTEEIIAGTDDGLLVTRFHYMNPVNPREGLLTALTRDGVFRIRDGEVVGAVKNMRFTDSVLRIFNSVAAISSDRQRTPGFFGNFFVPTVKVEDFHLTGKTEA